MSDKTIEGGAGPALAAHSKDASAPSKNPASSAKPRAPARKVRSTASKMANAVSNEVEASGGLGRLESLARDNPIAAMLATGIVGLILGSLLARN